MQCWQQRWVARCEAPNQSRGGSWLPGRRNRDTAAAEGCREHFPERRSGLRGAWELERVGVLSLTIRAREVAGEAASGSCIRRVRDALWRLEAGGGRPRSRPSRC